MSEANVTELTAVDVVAMKRLQLAAECDQRWAAAGETMWDVRAEVVMRLDGLLTGPTKAFQGAVGFDEDLARVTQQLAALALDELLARGRAEAGSEEDGDGA